MESGETYSVFIAEDEMPARELLVDYLLTRPELKLTGMAKNGEEALEKLSTQTYDLILLDIHLPMLSGIEVLEKLEKKPYVIFTTAYDRYAIKAFELGAVDYLLKPFTKERFDQSIDKYLQMQEGNGSSKDYSEGLGLSFREKGKHHLLAYEDIIYLSSNGKHSVIHTESRDFEAPIILKEIEKKLPDRTFERIHKQYIVNVQYISVLEYYVGGQYIAYLKDGDESSLPVGRKYAPTLKERFKI
jgi:DNA-binding LytR/AlgR family response regulator